MARASLRLLRQTGIFCDSFFLLQTPPEMLRVLDGRTGSEQLRMYSKKRFWQVVSPKLGGGRHRRTFKDRMEAQTYLDLAKTQLQNFGTAAMSISDALRAEAVKCAQLLEPFGKSIGDATHFYIDHLQEITRSQTVSHAVAELQAACKADGKSVRYLRDLKYRRGRFAKDFGECHVASVTTAELDTWLRQLNLGPVSRNTFRRRLVTLFKFAKTCGWCRTIPAAESTRVREVSDEVGILTPAELRGLLDVASENTIPYWVIGALLGCERQRSSGLSGAT
jgi:hypothetical protein